MTTHTARDARVPGTARYTLATEDDYTGEGGQLGHGLALCDARALAGATWEQYAHDSGDALPPLTWDASGRVATGLFPIRVGSWCADAICLFVIARED